MASKWGTCSPKVGQSTFIVLQEWCQLLEALDVEGIEEADIARAQKVFVNKLATVRGNSEVLPSVETFMLSVLHAHDHVLDTNTELALLVVSRLI